MFVEPTSPDFGGDRLGAHALIDAAAKSAYEEQDDDTAKIYSSLAAQLFQAYEKGEGFTQLVGLDARIAERALRLGMSAMASKEVPERSLVENLQSTGWGIVARPVAAVVSMLKLGHRANSIARFNETLAEQRRAKVAAYAVATLQRREPGEGEALAFVRHRAQFVELHETH